MQEINYKRYKADLLSENDPFVWYAAYGSNLEGESMMEYMSVGHQEYFNPDDFVSRGIFLPHNLYYASIHEEKHGAAAFLDVDKPGFALGRLWKLSYAQFRTLALLESRLEFQELPWEHILSNRNTVYAPDANYGRIVNLGTLRGNPVLTVTSPGSSSTNELDSPYFFYAESIVEGWKETSFLPFEVITHRKG